MKYGLILLSVFTFIFVGCGGEKTPDEYYAVAEQERNAKNIKSSLVHLENLIKYHPQDSLASQAQYLIGDIYMNDLRDFENAMTAYTKVVTQFRGSNYEAQAQFMIGYLQANYIGNVESARASYKLFLEKFPNHELTPSVQFELENLGKDINDIPVLRHITS